MCNRGLEEQLANMECNATSAVSITHHFLNLMVRALPVAAASALAPMLTFLPYRHKCSVSCSAESITVLCLSPVGAATCHWACTNNLPRMKGGASPASEDIGLSHLPEASKNITEDPNADSQHLESHHCR